MNAAKELMAHIGTRTLKCAKIIYSPTYADPDLIIILKVNYTQEEYGTFLHSLHIDYDDGYGRQYLDGTLWFTDGTWSTRGEYDGSEWWDHHDCPEITEDLK